MSNLIIDYSRIMKSVQDAKQQFEKVQKFTETKVVKLESLNEKFKLFEKEIGALEMRIGNMYSTHYASKDEEYSDKASLLVHVELYLIKTYKNISLIENKIIEKFQSTVRLACKDCWYKPKDGCFTFSFYID